METANFKLISGSAPILRFELLRSEDVSGWTTVFYVTDKLTGEAVFSTDGGIAGVPDAAIRGIFDVPLSAFQTNSFDPKTYRFSFWRTNTDFETPLVSGIMSVKVV